VFCSTKCRHAGERRPEERADAAQVARLFDGRPDDELVAEDEWHSSGNPEFAQLYRHESLGRRRREYRNLLFEGMLGRLPSNRLP
jgi:hypothetical protein